MMKSKKMVSKPDLKPASMKLSKDYANRLLGINLKTADMKSLLKKMRYGVEIDKHSKGTLNVMIPAYRTDVLHPIDVVEDIAIAYRYDNFNSTLPATSTPGERDRFQVFSSTVRELMIGGGFQEVMTLVMTNKNNLFSRMNTPTEPAVETEKPISTEYSLARTWLLPSVMGVLEKNRSREYPQKIFEIGQCISADGTDITKLSAVIARSKTSFSEIKATVEGILGNLSLRCEVRDFKHGSFIPGRCASIDYGFLGEIHPVVLEKFGLEVPVTAFEIDLDGIFSRME